MFACISPLITRGVIDNTAKDLIDLRLWCVDGQEPLHFRMAGNCLRDIAGCRVEFTNKASVQHVTELPAPVREFRHCKATVFAGDITLSRREQEKNNRGFITNHLYVEFYVGTAVRVLIQTSEFTSDISLPQWIQTWSDDSTQQMVNMEALHRHVRHTVDSFRGPGISHMADMPACEWDAKLNTAEAYMAIYPTIKEKYASQPGGYLSAAYVMNRTAFLGQEAAADEASMPPDRGALSRDWNVLDFFPPEESEAVRQAMQHPLFSEASRMTALVQRHLIDADERVRDIKEVGIFLGLYAGLVSHLLSTILYTQQAEYSRTLAITRMRCIARRFRTLPQLCARVPGNTPSVLARATERMLQHMLDFTETIAQ